MPLRTTRDGRANWPAKGRRKVRTEEGPAASLLMAIAEAIVCASSPSREKRRSDAQVWKAKKIESDRKGSWGRTEAWWTRIQRRGGKREGNEVWGSWSHEPLKPSTGTGTSTSTSTTVAKVDDGDAVRFGRTRLWASLRVPPKATLPNQHRSISTQVGAPPVTAPIQLAHDPEAHLGRRVIDSHCKIHPNTNFTVQGPYIHIHGLA